ncbi:hypothetical protein INR49_025878 [Caranx melampygus]|nr:hypothetical protein INR49_025878 [Caranx melampygus]
MSFAFMVTTMLLGSTLVVAFVLQPSKEEPAASANAPVSQHRCHAESLEFIRKSLLRALNLRTEPRLPVGALDSVRQQWRGQFSTTHRAKHTVVPAVSVSPDGGNTGLKCCSLASEIFMTDLGWNNWVIQPSSLTIVQCALCNPDMNPVECPSSHANVQDPNSQVPCCQPASQEEVPIVYVDESNTLVMSSMQLTRSCSCGPLLLAGGPIECSEKETLVRLKPIASMVAQLTECLVECSGMTFIKKLRLQDRHNIRFTDSTQGDVGEYCWSTDLQCIIGESFLHAYVVLPVNTTMGHEQLEVQATVPTFTKLHMHNSPTTIAESCGLRYDITEHFSSAATAGTTFCVQPVTQEGILMGSFLKCPPYLVTFWQRNPNQSNQQGEG